MKGSYCRIAGLAQAIAAAALASGCSVLGIGEEEFACSGMPGNPYCASARDVYGATNDGTVPSAMKAGGAYNPKCRDCRKGEGAERAEGEGQGQDASAGNSGRAGSTAAGPLPSGGGEIGRNYVVPAIPGRPVPIRTPAQVMRIWIAPYVDRAGDLMAPGLVYTEIEPRRWIYPDASAGLGSRSFTPLSSVRRYSGAVDSATKAHPAPKKTKGKKK